MRNCTLLLLSVVTIFGGQLFAQDNTAQNEQPQRPDYFAQYFTLRGVEFTKEQQAKVAQIENEYRPKLQANEEKWNSIITPQQNRARSAAYREARDKGLEDEKLRAAVSAAVKLTDEQLRQQVATQRERNTIIAEIREKLIAILPQEQQARFRRRPIAQKEIPPTHANVKYGDDARSVLDLWVAESDKPTPLVIYIHGGGFLGGSKEAARMRRMSGSSFTIRDSASL